MPGFTRTFANALALVCLVSAAPRHLAAQSAPDNVDFKGRARSNISESVAIPANTAFVWTSGTGPSVADTSAPAGSPARYGDMKTQSASALRNVEAALKERGLSLKDVVYLRAYLVPESGGAVDSRGWNEAYGQFFNTAENPVKPARSTVAVAALVVPAWLVEIEAFAVYPKR
jgi:enamine deaminase RidA (YjgF/YER057c/UK114 family)